ncbi:GDP-mannose 4,6-dehydratase [Patescibacteria group bacterium]|nr:GDP-mannose 4,6-dehydratase [Patescibacteria group bacterium]MCL5091922.1 GDP-mannose 4,6-dehydratase [Patescibacteria group bacterium]
MNVLITGGVGFIGTNCVAYFSRQKHQITVVDNFSRAGVDQNAAYLLKLNPKLTIVQTDVRRTRAYLQQIKRADLIIHLAGQTAVTTSMAHPDRDFSGNLIGGFSLLDAVRRHNPHAVVLYASTNKVYGDLHLHRIRLQRQKEQYADWCHQHGIDEDARLDFISPYGCSKGAVDCYFRDYARSFGLKTVVFRQSCIYGPHQLGVEDQGWVAHFAKQTLRQRPITIFGDGFQVRDLLHVDDLIDAYQRAFARANTLAGQAINVGGGTHNAFSLIQVIRLLSQKIGTTPRLTYQPARPGDQLYFVSTNRRARTELGWKPTISFSSGVDSLIGWQRRHL